MLRCSAVLCCALREASTAGRSLESRERLRSRAEQSFALRTGGRGWTGLRVRTAEDGEPLLHQICVLPLDASKGQGSRGRCAQAFSGR